MPMNTQKTHTMKNKSTIVQQSLRVFLFAMIVLGMQSQMYADVTPRKIEKEFSITGFTGIEAGSNFNVLLIPSENEGITISIEEAFMDNVQITLKGSTLVLDYNNNKSPQELTAVVRYNTLETIIAHGAAFIHSDEIVKSPYLKLKSSGAARIALKVETENLRSDASGASQIQLEGTTKNHEISIIGAADVMASKLLSSKVEANISGAGNAVVDAKDQLDATLKGSGNIAYVSEPTIKSISKSTSSRSRSNRDSHKVNIGNSIRVETSEYYDSTNVKVGGIEVQILDDDSVKVSIGRHQIIVDDDGNVNFRRRVRNNFNGHWGGFGLGINGYVNSDFNMDFPKEYEYMDLYMAKSISVHLNLLEHNFQLSKNGKFGLITGLGLEWHNYRFSKNVTITPDSSTLLGYYNSGARFEKYKLVINHLVVPIIFEYQTHALRAVNDFHIGVGVVLGLRYASHTKRKFDERNKEYDLIDPITGKVVMTATTPDQRVGKVHDDFHLAPFKADATFTIGWGYVNLFGTYSLSEMFRKNRGPELYPYTIGIMLVGW